MPTVVFLVGQRGAGKSRLTELVATQLKRHGGFVNVDSDLYKPYHPAYTALMGQDDTLMAAYTRADGRAWMAQAEQYVLDATGPAGIRTRLQALNAAARQPELAVFLRDVPVLAAAMTDLSNTARPHPSGTPSPTPTNGCA
jgi:ABC-type nitrate/sulfonate/bicarbonate transport system ATPase subunit